VARAATVFTADTPHSKSGLKFTLDFGWDPAITSNSSIQLLVASESPVSLCSDFPNIPNTCPPRLERTQGLPKRPNFPLIWITTPLQKVRLSSLRSSPWL